MQLLQVILLHLQHPSESTESAHTWTLQQVTTYHFQVSKSRQRRPIVLLEGDGSCDLSYFKPLRVLEWLIVRSIFIWV